MAQQEWTARLSERRRQRREESNQGLPLFALPPELRNQILSIVLPQNQIFSTFSNRKHYIHAPGQETQLCQPARTARDFQRRFAVTQVCRQIRADTLKVAYATNIFLLFVDSSYWTFSAERWVESRPPEILPSISKIALELSMVYGVGCGQLRVIFDLGQESSWVIYDGCRHCFPYNQMRFARYDGLARRDALSTPKERLLTLIGDFR